MNYTIEQSLLAIEQQALKGKHFIIAHESGNAVNTGANSLQNEIQYMKRNWQNAFVSHWVGSGGRIIQIAKSGKVQWGAGHPANSYAYAQVELARTKNRATFAKDYQAYVWLLRQLALEAGIPLKYNTGSSIQDKGIKSHSWVSRQLGGTDHTDPDGYLAGWGVSQDQFRRDLEAGTAGSRQVVHVVRKGDTLWSLARNYGTTVSALKSLNRLQSDLIRTGQQLIIKN